MRYYNYLSESKLEMLLEQVPYNEKVKATAEMKVNVGIFSAKFNAETMLNNSKIKRFEFLEKYIEKNESVGNCYNPKSWIKEENITMRIIQPFGFMNQNSTLFIKHLNANTILVLGGSTSNMVGNKNSETVYSSYSYTERVLDSLECFIRNNNDLTYKDEHKDFIQIELNGAVETPGNWKLEPLFNICSELLDNASIPEQKLSFLAKKLIIDVNHNKTIIIASPLFVYKND